MPYYGDTDTRTEIARVTDQNVRKNARAVAAVFHRDDLTIGNNGQYVVSSSRRATLRDRVEDDLGKPLCSGEQFENQPAAARCTAFLVRSDLLVTAGHCLDNNDWHEHLFVFSYLLGRDGSLSIEFPEENVFKAESLIGWKKDGWEDWAVIQLDRPVTGVEPLVFSPHARIAADAEVYTIGHPKGLPQKFAGNARIRESRPKYFICNLDTYSGNSGSPVFDSSTHKVVGMLVNGDGKDFVKNGRCYVSNRCPADGCRGEYCTQINRVDAPGL